MGNPSPPPPISISPGSPPTSPQSNASDEKETLLVSNHNHPATIVEEQHEHDEGLVMNKSSLSLPFEQSPSTSPTLSANMQTTNSLSIGNPVKSSLPERSQSDRRKLSVTNIMSFGERRRSTSSIFSDMRKMSITNFDNLKSPGVGKYLKYSSLIFGFDVNSSNWVNFQLMKNFFIVY